MTAAVEAVSAGRKVIVIEKMPIVGGNTSRATGGMNAAGTSIQATAGIKDDVETFYNDTFTGGKEENDPDTAVGSLDLETLDVDLAIELFRGLARRLLLAGPSQQAFETPGPHLHAALLSL